MPKSKKDLLKHKNSELDLVDIKFDYDLKRHEMRMEELRFVRETENINYNNAIQRINIKDKAIKKAHDRRQAMQYPRGRF